MKLSKKVIAAFGAVAALAAAGMFVSCSDDAGNGDVEGKKDNATMTVDGTDSASTKLEKAYRRYWKQLGTSEKVAEITTTVTIDLNQSVKGENGGYVAGFVFDMNKNLADSTKFDFCLLGFNPDTKKYYLENYKGLAALSSLDTDDTSLGTNEGDISNGDWTSAAGHYKEDATAKTISFVVQLKQTTKKTYDIYMYAPGGSATAATKIGSYTSDKTGAEITVNGAKTTEYATGAIGVYGNVGQGNKIVATYVTDTDSVTGKFFDEVVED